MAEEASSADPRQHRWCLRTAGVMRDQVCQSAEKRVTVALTERWTRHGPNWWYLRSLGSGERALLTSDGCYW